MKRKSYCVYIMGSLSGTLYIGVTGNLHKRAFDHKFHRRESFTDKYDVEPCSTGNLLAMSTKPSPAKNNSRAGVAARRSP